MKIIKWILGILLTIFLVFEAVIFITGKSYINRVFALTIFSGKMGPDIDELDLFPSHIVQNATPQPWPVSSKFNLQKLNDAYAVEMEKYQTVSYLVIKNDSIIFEKHWEGYNDSSLVNSFSMAKSITGLLIGCAIQDGLITSVNDPVSKYIPEFDQPVLNKITLYHLLTMSSGLDFKEDYVSPLAWPAEAYYGKDVNALTLSQSTAITPPGKIWHYKGGDSQLLGIILKQVTGKSIAAYASEKLWKPMGAEHPAYWSLDDMGMEKVSCCWYTNAKDYARLAKLLMQHGKWNGEQLVDSSYIQASQQPAQLVNQQGEPSTQYGYQWWLMQHKGLDIVYARGIRGQYIFAIPEKNMIVVRLGHKRAKKTGDELPDDIFTYLDAALGME
ncbi:MAG: class C beta-lactamase-related serine hydrolase [Bacteroidetes bacterium]|nr:MAG: class C beta-lactamase-related serine hydrolase [Bacteroidota bacterium]